jgi:D-amino peptidase
VDFYRLNGQYIGEIAQWALFAGAFGLPAIFLSGDEAACREAEALIPGIVTAAVKRGVSRGAAISLSCARAHALIREGMKKAVEKQKRDPIRPLVWPGPYRLEIRYKDTNIAEERERAGWERLDPKTVAKEADSVVDIIYA